MKQIITVILVFSFLWTNCVWANDLSVCNSLLGSSSQGSNKLSAVSQIEGLIISANLLGVGLASFKVFCETDVSPSAFTAATAEVVERVAGRSGVSREDLQEKVSWLALEEGKVLYVFFEEGGALVYLRFCSEDGIQDELQTVLGKSAQPVSELDELMSGLTSATANRSTTPLFARMIFRLVGRRLEMLVGGSEEGAGGSGKQDPDDGLIARGDINDLFPEIGRQMIDYSENNLRSEIDVKAAADKLRKKLSQKREKFVEKSGMETIPYIEQAIFALEVYDKKEFDAIVLEPEGASGERQWCLGFNSLAPEWVNRFENYFHAPTLGYVREALDHLAGDDLLEYLLHEALCRYVGHSETRMIQEILFSDTNYKGIEGEDGKKTGRLNKVLSGIINDEAIEADDSAGAFQAETKSPMQRLRSVFSTKLRVVRSGDNIGVIKLVFGSVIMYVLLGFIRDSSIFPEIIRGFIDIFLEIIPYAFFGPMALAALVIILTFFYNLSKHINALIRSRKSPYEMYIFKLSSSNESVVLDALRRLGRLDSAHAIRPLLRRYGKGYRIFHSERAIAATKVVLDRLNGGLDRHIGRCVDYVQNDKDINVRIGAIWDLGRLKDTRAMIPLLKIIISRLERGKKVSTAILNEQRVADLAIKEILKDHPDYPLLENLQRESFSSKDIAQLLVRYTATKNRKTGRVIVGNLSGRLQKADLGRVVLDDQMLIERGGGARPRMPSGPIGKEIAADDEYSKLARIDIAIEGLGFRLGETQSLPGGAEHAKYDNIEPNREMLNQVLKELVADFGIGILGAVDAIRIVDNIDGVRGRQQTVPYAKLERKEDNVVLIDVDAVGDKDLLKANLEHELRHSIVSLLPGVPVGLEELAVIYMSLKYALGNNLKIKDEQLRELSVDLNYFRALQVLRKRGADRTDEDILAVAIQHMKLTPYYESALTDVPVEFAAALSEWDVFARRAVALGQAGNYVSMITIRYEAAIDIFSKIERAKVRALTEKVEQVVAKEQSVRDNLTRVAGVAVAKNMVRPVKKIKMLVSSLVAKEIGLVETLLENKKRIRLDVDELNKPKNRNIVEWLQKILAGKAKSPFIFYSSTGDESVVTDFIMDNTLIQGEMTEEINDKEIDLLEIGKLNDRLSQDRLYLSLTYSISSIYLASQVVLAGGRIEDIEDALARNTIKTIYETLLNRNLRTEEWSQLFRTPWTILLPEIARVTEKLGALRNAIIEIEQAA